mgnify:FL=1
MGISQVDELNKKRETKKKETENYLKIIQKHTSQNSYDFINKITLDTQGLIDKFSRDSIRISVIAEVSSG